jgi:hypothetical protein
MSMMNRYALASLISTVVAVGPVAAQPAPTEPAPPQMPQVPQSTLVAPTPYQPADAPAPPPAADDKKPKEPKRGDFDAGGQVRLPSGPDEMGKYATYNWIAADLKGRYFLLDSVSVNGNIPLAVKKPGMLLDGREPSMIGGMTVRLDAKLPKMPKMPGMKYETEIGLSVTGAVMREGAMLLSEKDYPLFTGGFKPGLASSLIMKIKLSSAVDFSLLPAFVFQTGTAENLTAVQIPMSLILSAGSLLKLSTDVGVFTGDNYSFSSKKGGRVYLGAAIDLKLGPIIAHAGAGFASLITDAMGLYPSIGDSVYIDLNVKYAK